MDVCVCVGMREIHDQFLYRKPTIKSTGEKKIKTLADLKSEEEGDDEKESYFAGGAQSGIQIQDPNKKKNANDIVSEVFKAAKK
jgi:hypothetical protein